MSYLEFKQKGKKAEIWNKDGTYLGALERIRVGAWMSWCLTDVEDPSVYFSASCLDEIRAAMKELNGNKKAKVNLDINIRKETLK